MKDFAFAWPIWGNSTTSARDQARFFYAIDRLVAGGTALRAAAPREHRPVAALGDPAGAPPGWTIHFKGGWGSGTGLVTHQSALLLDGSPATRALRPHALEPEPPLRDADDPRRRGDGCSPLPPSRPSRAAQRKRGARLSHLGWLRRPPRMTALLVLSSAYRHE